MTVAEVDGESHVVGAVVMHFESGDLEIPHAEGDLLEDGGVVFLDAAGDAVAAEQAVDHAGSAVEAEMAVCAQQIVGEFDVVGMVVGEQEAFDMAHGDSGGVELVGDFVGADAGVDDHSSGAGAYVAAVAARS